MDAAPKARFSIRIDNFVDDDTGTTFYRTSCDLLLDDRGSMIRRFSSARRYSEFKAMHAELAPQLEKLPSKFLVPKRLRHSHSAKLQRAAALQDYLTAVVSAVGDQAVARRVDSFTAEFYSGQFVKANELQTHVKLDIGIDVQWIDHVHRLNPGHCLAGFHDGLIVQFDMRPSKDNVHSNAAKQHALGHGPRRGEGWDYGRCYHAWC